MMGTGVGKADRVRCRELMHSHANPNRQLREKSARNAAMQIGGGSLGPDHSGPFIPALRGPTDVQLHRGQ
jgi:hypothetical protein